MGKERERRKGIKGRKKREKERKKDRKNVGKKMD